MVELKNVEKIYTTKSKHNVYAIKSASISFVRKEMVFILGQSGSGKTTLLNLLGGIDSQTSGEIFVDGKLLGKDLSLEAYRRNYVGFVFQEYNLIDSLNVFENIALAITEKDANKRKSIVFDVLEKVELKGYQDRKISELSGGQKQRVAIARALAKNSQILLCDEPTGNLDSKTSREIFCLLKELSKEKTVIVVSHNEELSRQFADRVITISDGEVFDENENFVGEKTQNTEVVKNVVPMAYKIKLSLKNLFSNKFKTIISFCLMFLSLFSVSVMQICWSYNAESAIANTTKNEKTLNFYRSTTESGDNYHLVKNQIDTSIFPLNETDYAECFSNVSLGQLFVVKNDNSVLNQKEFYFRNELDDGCAYVTDYYVDFVVNKNSDYTTIAFKDYAELSNVAIEYKGQKLFKIAGIIKTDYKQFSADNELDFTDENFGIKGWNNELKNLVNEKLSFEYKVCYVTEATFNSLDLNSRYSYSFLDNSVQLVTVNDKSFSPSRINLYDTDKESLMYFDSSDRLKTNDLNDLDQNASYQALSDDKIIISDKLYNLIFDENIDSRDLYNDYVRCVAFSEKWTNPLDKLNTPISITIKDANGKTVLDIKNKIISGVLSELYYEISGYDFYLSKTAHNLKNTELEECTALKINWSNVKNKAKFLKTVRQCDHFVSGPIGNVCYEMEEMVKLMGYFFIVVACVCIIITLLAMLNLVNTKIRDNKRQIGILMGLGFTGKDVVSIYLLTLFYLLAVALILVVPLSYLSAYIVNKLFYTTALGYIRYFNVNIFTYGILGLSCLILFLFSIIPLIKLSRKRPVDIIKEKE